jgi:hypothetical protein
MSVDVPKTAGLVTLRYVVMSVLNRIKDYTMRDFYFLMQLCIEGFTELSLWHLDSLEVVYLHMSAAKVVTLPADFVDWTKIGVPINGKLRVLTRHDNVLLPRTFDDGTPVGNTDGGNATLSTESFVFFSDHFRAGQYVGGLFGLPGGIDEAYYRFDRERRTIAFSGSVPRSEIVLEYISSGVKLTGTTMVPREAVPALRTYILWQMVENDKTTSGNEKERRKRNHEEEISALRCFQDIFTIEEYKRMLWGTSRQTPKR